MSTGFGRWLKKISRRRRTHATRGVRQLLKGFERFGVDLVFDVGANVGQFGSEIRTMGFAGRIVSFEPLSAAHARLSAAAKRDPAWSVHPRCAIGDHDGTVEINIAGNSVSSSISSVESGLRSVLSSSSPVGISLAPGSLRSMSTSAMSVLQEP